jgi:glycosyltransferase involved in cell wall biosynthesis
VGQVADLPEPANSPVRVLALRSVDGAGGGAEAVVLRTAARLDPTQVRMVVCCIRRTGDAAYDFDRRAAALGIDYCEVEQKSILARGVLPALRKIVVQRQIQIVDAQDYKATFFAFCLAHSLGVTPVATLHGWSGHHWRERLVYYPAERLLAATFPMAVAVSGEMRETLVRWGCRPGRVRVLANGIDPAEFRRNAATTAQVRKSLGIDAADTVIGAVGRLAREKRFDVLLEAMAQLLPRRPELQLIVVGEGDRRDALQRQMRRLGITHRCRLLGHRRDVIDLYQAMDVFVQSSDHEGSPTVVVEAMAMQVPVVATGVGGTSELVEHGVHGLLVPRRDPPAMAAAVERTLGNREATAGRIAAARRRVENELSFDARTRRLEKLYRELARWQ